MEKIIWILFCLMSVQGLHAQEQEIVRIYTDKDCYLTGEELWIKVCVEDSLYPGNAVSRVAYVEVCDARQIHAQGKIALHNGTGWGRIRFPQTMHSGVYQLTAYTRYMRNLPTECFPKKTLAVLNAVQAMEEDAIVAGDSSLLALPDKEMKLTVGRLSTDKVIYSSRSKVTLTGLEKLTDAHELTLSVVREDCKVLLPSISVVYLPQDAKVKKNVAECEGHIVTGRLTGVVKDNIQTRLACVGKNIHLFDGQLQKDGTYLFYTAGVTNQQDIVLSTIQEGGQTYRLEPVSPFAEVLPDTLPYLRYWYDEKELIERSLGSQLNRVLPADSTGQQPIPEFLFGIPPTISYNLNEYVRFNTVRETFIEFVMGTRIDKLDGETVVRTLQEDGKGFSNYKALVLLDGIPIENHEAVLSYNARHLHFIHQYHGKYTFGGKTHDGIVSLITHRGDFPDMRIDSNAQMFAYEFPQERPVFVAPVYDTEEKSTSRFPDFRHTLYWLPDIEPGAKEVSFYTSDMKGVYTVTLQGIALDGRRVEERCEFIVK